MRILRFPPVSDIISTRFLLPEQCYSYVYWACNTLSTSFLLFFLLWLSRWSVSFDDRPPINFLVSLSKWFPQFLRFVDPPLNCVCSDSCLCNTTEEFWPKRAFEVPSRASKSTSSEMCLFVLYGLIPKLFVCIDYLPHNINWVYLHGTECFLKRLTVWIVFPLNLCLTTYLFCAVMLLFLPRMLSRIYLSLMRFLLYFWIGCGIYLKPLVTKIKWVKGSYSFQDGKNKF